jgi:hypothetical protein
VTDTRMYLGRPGAPAAIRNPRGVVESTRVRRTATFELGTGGVAVDQMVGGARTWTINYEQLTREDFATLQAFLDGHEGPGPFTLLDPAMRNMLPANISGATSVTNDVAGVRPVGGFVVRSLDDDFNRAPAASAWNTATTGQSWSLVGGVTSDYNIVTGGNATMKMTSVNVIRSAIIDTGHTDFDFTTDVSFDVGTPTGAAVTQYLYGRYFDSSNYYQAQVQVSTAGVVTAQLFRRVGGTGAPVGSAVTLASSHAAGDRWRIRFQGIQGGGTCNLKMSAQMVLNDQSTTTTGWLIQQTDSNLTTGTSIGLAGRLESGNTNTLPVTYTWYGVTAESMNTTESSSTAYTDAGPRVLGINFSAAPSGTGAVGIGMSWPSSTFTYGVPVVAGRALCFSCWVRGGGTDPITTWTAKIIWRDTTGLVTGSTTTGSGAVASSAGAWAQLYAQGTPPAGTAYADVRVDYTSGALAGAVAYFRRFMLNEGTTPDTAWVPGTGVFPVRFMSMTDAWPFQSPELRAAPVVVLQEDVS